MNKNAYMNIELVCEPEKWKEREAAQYEQFAGKMQKTETMKFLLNESYSTFSML